MNKFKLFYRNDCHLCEDMQQLLKPYESSHKLVLEMINIDKEASLKNKYGMLIPVLTDAAENEVCHYFFDKVAFEQYLST